MGILRPMERARRMVALTLGLVVAVSASPAWADADAVARAREEARALADKGYAELQRGRYDAAIELFSKAEARFHAPTILLMIADAQVKAQRLIEAKATYERIASESLVNYAPQEFFDAQKKARAAATSLISRIPRLTIRVSGAPSREGQRDARRQARAGGVHRQGHRRRPGTTHREPIGAEGMQLASVSVLLKERADEKLTLNAGRPRRANLSSRPPPRRPLRPRLRRVKPTPSRTQRASWTAQLPGYAMLGLGAGGPRGGHCDRRDDPIAGVERHRRLHRERVSELPRRRGRRRALPRHDLHRELCRGRGPRRGAAVCGSPLDPLGGDAPKSDARASRGLTQLGLGPGTFALRGTF
jgi:hypothetical protein